MQRINNKLLLASIGILFLVSGCAFTRHDIKVTPPDYLSFNDMVGRFKKGDIIDTRTGMKQTKDELYDALACKKVIFIGENHIHPEDHKIQADIIQALIHRDRSVAIGLEMVPQNYQHILNCWTQGELSESEFLEKIDWAENWGYDFSLYREIFYLAKKHSLPLIALNIPRQNTNKAAYKGVSSIPMKEQSNLSSHTELDNPFYKRYLKMAYDKHGTDNNFDHFYHTQALWDRTMAQRVVDYLNTHSEKTIIVLAGKGHVVYRFGIPDQVIKQIPVSCAVLIPLPVGYEDHDPLHNIPGISRLIGDYVWVTGQPPLPAPRPKIGVVLETASKKESGVRVKDVIPDMPAVKAGIRKGDIIVKVDNLPIKTLMDIHQVFSKGGIRTYQITILREDVVLQFLLTPVSTP